MDFDNFWETVGKVVGTIFNILCLGIVYLGPIILCFVGGNLGTSLGSSTKADLDKIEADYTYTVTVYWDENKESNSEFDVRDCHDWNILDYQPKMVREGYEFGGLSKSPMGGTMYTNRAGYGIKNIKKDTVLYAVWIPTE